MGTYSMARGGGHGPPDPCGSVPSLSTGAVLRSACSAATLGCAGRSCSGAEAQPQLPGRCCSAPRAALPPSLCTEPSAGTKATLWLWEPDTARAESCSLQQNNCHQKYLSSCSQPPAPAGEQDQVPQGPLRMSGEPSPATYSSSPHGPHCPMLCSTGTATLRVQCSRDAQALPELRRHGRPRVRGLRQGRGFPQQ